jgi:hypothetical protein
MGVGGGVFFVPILILLVGLTPHLAVGSSLGVILLAAAVGVVKKGLAEYKVNLAVAMSLLIGSSIGVQIGAYVCNKIHGRHLRRYFAILILLAVAIIASEMVTEFIGH